MASVTQLLRDHYRATFLAHGASSQGVDWGPREEAARLRQDMMLAVADGSVARSTLLDVGCGYGALADRIDDLALALDYTGIDVVHEMVDEGRRRHPDRTFLHGDFLDVEALGTFDYVVCNGILTQKLATSTLDMNTYARRLIPALFAACRRGCAFNVMSTYVNYQAQNLYYRNPSELLAWCMTEITSRVRLNHAYPLYEYTIYLYREDAHAAPGGASG